jgi:peptidyl-prolyl cis-trans isomerase SurA
VSEAEAKRKLVALKERLDNNADFAELARLHSNDLSAAKGGDLGWLYQGDTVPEFEKAMDALQINQISQPVQSPFGFHLIQVLERRTENATDERQRLAARQSAARAQGRRGVPGLGPANTRPRLCRVPRRRALAAIHRR